MSERATVPEKGRGIVPNERAARPIDPGVDIGHVHLKAADLNRIRAFYVDVLGFDVVFHAPDALFLTAGGYHHTLGFNTWHSRGGSPPPPQATGLYHVAIRYPTRAALGDALRRLAAAGWPIDGFNDHGTHEAIYLRDSEENGLELCWDRSPEEWPRDAEGHLAMSDRRLDLDGLFREGQEPGQQEETAQLKITTGS
jgi:catechol 2,3-dioxygenase